MKNFLLADNNRPLILHGNSGCGKTAILAKFTSQVICLLFYACFLQSD